MSSNESSFATDYPEISQWVLGGGWIEIGNDHNGYAYSFVRALDEGGLVYSGTTVHETMDEAFNELNEGIRKWLKENS